VKKLGHQRKYFTEEYTSTEFALRIYYVSEVLGEELAKKNNIVYQEYI
jgi:hypothetical protein